VPASKKH
jgi:hypothetical protein